MTTINKSLAASGETLIYNHECELAWPVESIFAQQIISEIVPQDDYEYNQKYRDYDQQVVCTVYVIDGWKKKSGYFTFDDFSGVDCYWLEGDSACLEGYNFSKPGGVWVDIEGLPKCDKFLYSPDEFTAMNEFTLETGQFITYACRFLPPRTAKSGYFIAGGKIPGYSLHWEFTNTYTGNKTIPEGYDGYVSSSPTNKGYTWPVGRDVIYCNSEDINNVIPVTSYKYDGSFTFNEFNYRTINNIYVKDGVLRPLGRSYVSSYISGSSASWYFTDLNFGNDLTASLTGVSGYEKNTYGDESLPYYPYTANNCHIESGVPPM